MYLADKIQLSIDEELDPGSQAGFGVEIELGTDDGDGVFLDYSDCARIAKLFDLQLAKEYIVDRINMDETYSDELFKDTPLLDQMAEKFNELASDWEICKADALDGTFEYFREELEKYEKTQLEDE